MTAAVLNATSYEADATNKFRFEEHQPARPTAGGLYYLRLIVDYGSGDDAFEQMNDRAHAHFVRQLGFRGGVRPVPRVVQVAQRLKPRPVRQDVERRITEGVRTEDLVGHQLAFFKAHVQEASLGGVVGAAVVELTLLTGKAVRGLLVKISGSPSS